MHPSEHYEGWWWRADRYEARDGYIRPAEGATFEQFNPWEGYRKARREVRRIKDLALPGPSPHGDILKVADDWCGQQVVIHDDSMAPAILDFCSRWGLLGTALHNALEVTLHPVAPAPSDSPDVTYCQRRHFVSAGTWHTITALLCSDEPPEGSVTWREPPVVFERRCAPTAIDKPPENPNAGTGFRLAGHAWTDYFPSIPIEKRRTYQYPSPKEESFWKLYAEPIDEWRSWLQHMRNLALFLPIQGNPLFDGSPKPVGTTEAYIARGHANFILQLLHTTSAAAPSLKVISPGLYEQRWAYPSLLTAIALMIREDLLGNSAAFCANPSCHRYFRKQRQNQKFCSGKCKNATGVRNFRHRRPAR